MNILTIIVLAVIALCAYGGYRQGFFRVVYSLVGWVLVIGIVTFSSPYITRYLEEETKIRDTIQEKCLEYLEKSPEEKSGKSTEEEKESFLSNDIPLPKAVAEGLTKSAQGTEELILGSGIYENIAESVSHFILEGISFFAAFLLASILVKSLAGVLDIVSHLPVVKDVNKALGVMAGGIKGLLIVWLAFYLLAVCITNELAREIFTYVEESPVLLVLYKNNLLLLVIMAFIK